jgi:predicted GNAT family acetyltransferase
MTDAITDNAEAHQYELPVEGLVAVAKYNLSDHNLMISEVLVPPALEGRGIAGRLVLHAIEDARRRNLLVLPVCPFAAAWLRKHPEHADAVHPRYRDSLGL